MRKEEIRTPPQSLDYLQRHLGPSKQELPAMLREIGVEGLSELIEKTIPPSIRLEKEIDLPEALSEHGFLEHIRTLAQKNQVFQNCIGQGYYETITPSVIQRNLFENPGWYTQYTPYQPEISQGRLEALFNYQTMVSDLTGMDIANASLLDEATSAAEAMSMLFRVRDRALQKSGASAFFVSKDAFLQTKAVLRTRAKHLGIPIIEGDPKELLSHPEIDSIFGVLLQYPDATGEIHDYRQLVKQLSEKKIRTVVAADLLALCLLTPPGEWGADVVVGSVQRFGVPMGFGGPHAGYFATKDEFKRNMAGRLVGLSKDVEGKPAYRLALQTREQHIRREKATSNICTAQALLANMAGMYAVYHGKEGLKKIATEIHTNTNLLRCALERLGYKIKNTHFFDTLCMELSEAKKAALQTEAEKRKINLCYFYPDEVRLSLGEGIEGKDLQNLIEAFLVLSQKAQGMAAKDLLSFSDQQSGMPKDLLRKGGFLEQQVFSDYRNETLLMRYLNLLAKKDLALDTAMIPLGSCTMKLNPATAMIPVSFPEFSKIHPFAPENQIEGYKELIKNLELYLAKITGLAATSLQPNSGAQGEYAGLLAIRAYQKSLGEEKRNLTLIPASAHGTNPASAALAGMQVVVVKCDKAGNIDLADLKEKCEKYSDTLSCLMVTYPSTHGVFEESIIEICDTVHKYGGQVYMDGANLNAQLGYTSPGRIGADVCHLNLHKTFAIPHGGGGPGVGPICVASHLAPFLPGDPLLQESKGHSSDRASSNPTKSAVGPVSAAKYGSASVLLISYAYIRMLGAEGLKKVTEYAILNANYIKARLEKDYKILYTGKHGFVAHEMILDTRLFKKIGIEVDDIAKRLMDYGFHAPTMSFPVPGTLMVEPTESEPFYELDRFCKAMLGIRKEIAEIESGRADPKNNVLKNAPHTAARLLSAADAKQDPDSNTGGGLPYSFVQAAFPLSGQEAYKFWPAVSRVDHVYGDRNLVCACPPVSEYEEG